MFILSHFNQDRGLLNHLFAFDLKVDDSCVTYLFFFVLDYTPKITIKLIFAKTPFLHLMLISSISIKRSSKFIIKKKSFVYISNIIVHQFFSSNYILRFSTTIKISNRKFFILFIFFWSYIVFVFCIFFVFLLLFLDAYNGAQLLWRLVLI